jgi:hypothetical protein
MSRLVNAAAAVGFLFAGSRSVVSGQPPAPLVTVCVYTKSAEFMDEAQKSRQAAVAALTQLLTSGFHVPPATANGIRLVEHASDANVTVEIGAVGLVPNFYRRPKDDFMWPPALRQV